MTQFTPYNTTVQLNFTNATTIEIQKKTIDICVQKIKSIFILAYIIITCSWISFNSSFISIYFFSKHEEEKEREKIYEQRANCEYYVVEIDGEIYVAKNEIFFI